MVSTLKLGSLNGTEPLAPEQCEVRADDLQAVAGLTLRLAALEERGRHWDQQSSETAWESRLQPLWQAVEELAQLVAAAGPDAGDSPSTTGMLGWSWPKVGEQADNLALEGGGLSPGESHAEASSNAQSGRPAQLTGDSIGLAVDLQALCDEAEDCELVPQPDRFGPGRFGPREPPEQTQAPQVFPMTPSAVSSAGAVRLPLRFRQAAKVNGIAGSTMETEPRGAEPPRGLRRIQAAFGSAATLPKD